MKNAQDLVIKLRAYGKKVFFVTNNSTKTREEFLSKFNSFGFDVTIEEIISSSYLSALYLKERNFTKKVYVVGMAGITKELKSMGIESLEIGPDPIVDDGNLWLSSAEMHNLTLDTDVGAVIVGFDQFFCYKKLFKAASYLSNKDVYFIATNTDEQFPAERKGFVIPGTGSIVNAVKTAADRDPIVIGKPVPVMFDFIQRSYKVEPNRALMIGDRANTDIMFGRNCGLWTLLVLSGVTSLQEVREFCYSRDASQQKCIPHFYLNGVADFYKLIVKTQP